MHLLIMIRKVKGKLKEVINNFDSTHTLTSKRFIQFMKSIQERRNALTLHSDATLLKNVNAKSTAADEQTNRTKEIREQK